MAHITKEQNDVVTAPANGEAESRRTSTEDEDLLDGTVKKKNNAGKAFANFLYNPRKKTVLGRDALNWGKLKKIRIKKIDSFYKYFS